MVIWIIGLSGSGKTTIGKEVFRNWKKLSANTVFVDGDDIRKIFGSDHLPSDYSKDARLINANRIKEICIWLDQQNINVVCCILSIFPKMQKENRKSFSNYYEVFVDVPINILVNRDDKGIYKKSLIKKPSNLVGIDIAFPKPTSADITIDNSKFNISPQTWANKIMKSANITKIV